METSVQITEEFEVMGTIKKTTTFASKGGGVIFQVEIGEKALAQKIINAEGAVCRFKIGVSAMRSGDEDHGDELGFDDLDGEDEK
jgi:hypothetical protein